VVILSPLDLNIQLKKSEVCNFCKIQEFLPVDFSHFNPLKPFPNEKILPQLISVFLGFTFLAFGG
jgi:hypothetical protein